MNLLHGRQTWIYENPPEIIGVGTVAGWRESQGDLAEYFDVIHKDNYVGQKTFEQAEQRILEEACNIAIRNSGVGRDEINFHFSGDLLNQITSSSFTARTLAIPYIGIYGACSTSVLGMALAGLLVSSGSANYALASTVSHNNTVEKQFRYPNEYGSQKNGTTQITVTGAGAGIFAKSKLPQKVDAPKSIKATSATIGKVVDLNISDPYNMGAAMAPAAYDTITRHFAERKIPYDYYDLILTGDLGHVGTNILLQLLEQDGIHFQNGKIDDGGKRIFTNDTKNLAGGSGCGCMALNAYGKIYKDMEAGVLQKVLLVATGALLSPLSTMQHESIPAIAHAISWEVL